MKILYIQTKTEIWEVASCFVWKLTAFYLSSLSATHQIDTCRDGGRSLHPLSVFLPVMQSDHGAEDAGWEGEHQPTVMWIKALKERVPAAKALLFQYDKLKVKALQPKYICSSRRFILSK